MLKFLKLLWPPLLLVGMVLLVQQMLDFWTLVPEGASLLLMGFLLLLGGLGLGILVYARKERERYRGDDDSQIQLRLATDAAHLGIWEYDLSSRMTRGNAHLWQLMGLDEVPADNTYPFNLAEHIHEADRDYVRLRFLTAIQEQSDCSLEYRVIHPKGVVIWLESWGSPVRDAQGRVIRLVGVTRDITKRKLSELDFQRSVDASPAILWIGEANGACTYMSQQWYTFTGQSQQDALGFGWLNAVHPDDREKARRIFMTCSEKRESFSLYYRLRTSNHQYRWVVDAGNPRFDTDATYLGYAGTIFDVHEQQSAQARLEETAQLFQALANSIPQMAWMADASGAIYWYNERWMSYTGLSLEEMKGEGWRKPHHPDYVEGVSKRFHEAIAEGCVWEDTFPLRSAEGDWRWFLSRAFPLHNEAGEIERWFGTDTDITELRDFQDALAESETRFRDLANSMPQVVWTANADGRVDYYNERANEFAGFERSDDGSWSWQPDLHPDDRDATVQAWRNAVAQRQIYAMEHRIRMKDGSYCWHISRGLPVFHSDGTVKKWYGTATNIQDLKLAQMELAKAKESAEEANKAKSRFLAHMSHEIRSPMSSVLGYADLLLEPGLADSDRLAYAASIKASGGHLLAIVDDILDLSAVESGEFRIDRQAFAVVELIAETVQSMTVLAQRKGLDVRVEFATPVPAMISSDPLRFRQVLLNLLSNAIKFTEKGRIIIRLSYRDHRFQLEVEDSGLGIEAGKVERLFKAFSQVDSGSGRKFGGTGLGLHLSRRLAEALDGDLSLRWSEAGKGSCFMFRLNAGTSDNTVFLRSFQDIPQPFVPGTELIAGVSRRGSSTLSADSSQNKPCSVLLAEDSTDNQILIKIFLKKLGAQVDIATNGQEAIRLASSGLYDVILMDMMMPVMDGLEATRRLRAMGYKKPIVALTAHALREEVEKSLAAGCDLHLTKPIQLDVLRRTLELIQNKSREEQGWEPSALH